MAFQKLIPFGKVDWEYYGNLSTAELRKLLRSPLFDRRRHNLIYTELLKRKQRLVYRTARWGSQPRWQ